MSYATHFIRQGRTTDRECSRSSARLSQTMTILKGMGAEPVFPEHTADCPNHPQSRNRPAFGYSVICESGCPHKYTATVTFPEWVTDEVIDMAYDTAGKLIEARAAWHHAEIAKQQAARADMNASARRYAATHT